jgi:hypothetical protein
MDRWRGMRTEQRENKELIIYNEDKMTIIALSGYY